MFRRSFRQRLFTGRRWNLVLHRRSSQAPRLSGMLISLATAQSLSTRPTSGFVLRMSRRSRSRRAAAAAAALPQPLTVVMGLAVVALTLPQTRFRLLLVFPTRSLSGVAALRVVRAAHQRSRGTVLLLCRRSAVHPELTLRVVLVVRPPRAQETRSGLAVKAATVTLLRRQAVPVAVR